MTLKMKLREFYEETRRRHIFNVLGIVASFLIGLIIPMFCIWQWDMIVTGPVWWEASPTGVGWHWDGPGGYFRAPFQCFIWRTTVGGAYDTLLFVLFSSIIASLILMFASIWTWKD